MRARYKHQQTGTTWDGRTFKVDHDYEHSAPMMRPERVTAYIRQGHHQRRLTVRQLRSLRKNERRAVARASALLAKS